jgi:RES domain-containing protein
MTPPDDETKDPGYPNDPAFRSPLFSYGDPAFLAAMSLWHETMPPPDEHPNSELIRTALESAEKFLKPFPNNKLYRASPRRYSNRNDSLSGFGSQLHGGRFNPPRSFRIVYLSIDPSTPHAEMKKAEARKAEGLADFPLAPVEELEARFPLATVQAHLEKVLDLTDEEVLALPKFVEAGIDRLFLTRDGWIRDAVVVTEFATQAVGRIAYDLGWHGLITHSSADGGEKNLDVFVGNLSIGFGLQILEPKDFPSHWRKTAPK